MSLINLILWKNFAHELANRVENLTIVLEINYTRNLDNVSHLKFSKYGTHFIASGWDVILQLHK